MILPTDTVYGVAADVRLDSAVQAIYGLKGRGPQFPLQLLFSPSDETLRAYANLSAAAARFIEAVGPGPWTVITPARDGWSSPALAGGRTVGIRIPDALTVHQVVDALGGPLAATSANPSGSPSPVTAREAVEGFASAGYEGQSAGWWIPIAVDGGRAAHGLDSTVIDCASDSPVILREGAIDRATVARILGLRDIPVVRSVRT